MSVTRRGGWAALLGAVLLAACTMTPPKPDYAAIVAAPDRSAADRQNDKRRAPVKMLAFIGVMPGWKIADMGAGAGYSTELLARATGPTGIVYAQNPPDMYPPAKKALVARAKTPAMKNVVLVSRRYDDPIPPGVHDLDLITFFYAYHDVTYMKVDRRKMDAALLAALKPGGYLVIADYNSLPGMGTMVAHTLHRIDEDFLRREIEAAGFKFVKEGFFLRNPNDPRNMPIFHPKIPIDIFVLKFQKPA